MESICACCPKTNSLLTLKRANPPVVASAVSINPSTASPHILLLFDRIHSCAKHQQQKDGRSCFGRTLNSNSDPSVWMSQLWTHVGDSHHNKSCLATFSFHTGIDLRGHKRYGSLETHNQEIHHTSLVDHYGHPLLHAYLKFWEGSTNSIQSTEITRLSIEHEGQRPSWDAIKGLAGCIVVATPYVPVWCKFSPLSSPPTTDTSLASKSHMKSVEWQAHRRK